MTETKTKTKTLVAVGLVTLAAASTLAGFSIVFKKHFRSKITPVCVAEGGSLGAVVPSNAKHPSCCPGLRAYIPKGMVGTYGTCVKHAPTAKCQNHPACDNAVNKGTDSNGCIIWECLYAPTATCQNHPDCADAVNKGTDSKGCTIWECPK